MSNRAREKVSRQHGCLWSARNCTSVGVSKRAPDVADGLRVDRILNIAPKETGENGHSSATELMWTTGGLDDLLISATERLSTSPT
jgi:hypothetical protein